MRKFNVMACALTSALAVSMGSINVLADTSVSAPANTVSSGDVSDLDDDSYIPYDENSSSETKEYVTGINISYSDGIISVEYSNPLDTHVSFINYEVLLKDKVIKSGDINSGKGGAFSFKPTEDGTYTARVYYKIANGIGLEGEPHVLEGTVTVSGVESTSRPSTSSETSQGSTTTTQTYLESAAPSNLNGKVSISYNVASGTLKAVSDVKGSKSFMWYKNGSEFSKNPEITPTEEGSYYCVMTDNSNEKDTSTSKTVTLYKVTGGDGVTFNSPNGLYEAGANVTASVKLSSDESVKKWKCSIKNIEVNTSGNTASFRMPNRSIRFSAKTVGTVKVSINGGKTDKAKVRSGDTFVIMADNKDGQSFSGWTISGAKKVQNANSSVTKVTAGDSDITISANFTSNPSTSSSSSGSSSSSSSSEVTYTTPVSTTPHEADAKHAVYDVLDAGGYNVKVEHHSQGPLCDAAFKYAQGKDWLVTDYFNITVNNSLTTYEIPNTVRIRITIPQDLQMSGRKWRMVCISKGGAPFSFEDEDSDDSTITFTTNRFYAYAMCYSDYVEPEPVVEDYTEPSSPDVVYEDENYDDSYKDSEYPSIETSVIRPSSESRIVGEYSDVMSSEYSNTVYYDSDNYNAEYLDSTSSNTDGTDGGSYYSSDEFTSGSAGSYDDSTSYDVPATSESGYAKPVQSDKKSAVEKSGNKTPTIYSL